MFPFTDGLQNSSIDSAPSIVTCLLNVLGAVIKGAQVHNLVFN